MSTPLVQQPIPPINLANPRMNPSPNSFNLPFHPHQHKLPIQPVNIQLQQSSFAPVPTIIQPTLIPRQHSPPRKQPSPPSISPYSRPRPSPQASLHSSSSLSTMASPSQPLYPQQYAGSNHNRRTLSNATSNSSSSYQPHVRRSSSNRSNNPTSYVALLRKQKATVWCDRSQAEDPRIAAAQRLAKERAEREVSAAPGQASRITPPSSHAGSFTSGVARKIRHHGVSKAAPFAGGNMAGAGVPLRLSATEVEDDDEFEDDHVNHSAGKDDDWGVDASFYGTRATSSGEMHHRTGSGRSSNGSRRNTMNELSGTHSRTASDATMGRLDEKTPLASQFAKTGDYFADEKSGKNHAESPEDDETRERKEDELRRRGSVDDRAMTMSGVRLFVANPDLDD